MKVATFLSRIILSSVACLTVSCFPCFLTNDTTFSGGKVTEHKMCFVFLHNVRPQHVIPEEYDHTPLMLHTSRATVYTHKSCPPTDCTISFITPTCFGCKPQPFSGNYKCCQHVNITFHSRSTLRVFQSGSSNVLTSGEKSSVTGCLGTTLYVVLLYVCCNFQTIFITLYLWKIPVCINILQFMLDNL